MRKKARKQRTPGRSVRRGGRTAHSTARKKVRKSNVESASPPWLQIVSSAIEDDPNRDLSWGYLSQRNGRRQTRDVDLYVPERKLRGR